MSATIEATVVDRVRQRLAARGVSASPSAVAAAVREETAGLVGDTDLLALLRLAQSEICGAGPLDALLAADDTSDVLVNGPEEIWVDRGRGLERAAVAFSGEEAVRRLAVRLAASAGRRLDDASPWVDATLPDGTRMHAVLPPVATSGTCLSLRVLRRRAFTLEQLVELGTMTDASAALVQAVVRGRMAFLVTGGTGSGKTTMLGVLLSLVDPSERLVLVEDASELRPDHPHVVRLTARPANVEGAGTVTLRDLVRQALRMRPDRLVVGEVRGAEVVDLLTALNAGHDGGSGTVHANSTAELPARLEGLAALGGMPREALHSLAAAAVQVAIHLRRQPCGRRVLSEVSLLRHDGNRLHSALAWDHRAGPGEAFPSLLAVLSARGVQPELEDLR